MSDKEGYLSPIQAPEKEEIIYTDHYIGADYKEAYSCLSSKQIELIELKEPPF